MVRRLVSRVDIFSNGRPSQALKILLLLVSMVGILAACSAIDTSSEEEDEDAPAVMSDIAEEPERMGAGIPAAEEPTEVPAPDPTEPADSPQQVSQVPQDQTITIARADWDTGWFQAEVFKHLLEQLGYTVTGPEKMAVEDIFQDIASGEVHMSPNGWFTLHNTYLEEVEEEVELVGSQVRGGALQGYLIDRKTAEEHGITSLDDLKQPDIAALFDRDGNGKADLVGCPEGWGCHLVIEHHMDAYALRESVEHIQGAYDDSMKETAARYEQGDPVLFYTWTPNWTLGQLVPGEDVVWLEVPFASLPREQRDREPFTTIPGVPGCPSDPCAMGFPANDIRVVANRAYLDAHPMVKRLFELVEIPLDDIAEQNVKMVIEGEDSPDDIARHAQEWIAANQQTVDDWMEEIGVSTEMADSTMLQQVQSRGVLRCGVQRDLPGFSTRQDDRSYVGFNTDFCRVVATAIFGTSEGTVEFVPLDVKDRLAAVSDRKVDVLFHNTTWTALADMGGMPPPNSGISVDFGPTVYHDGQRFMVRQSLGLATIDQLAGMTICVLKGADAERNLEEHFVARSMDYKPGAFESIEEVYEHYESGLCDAVTGDTAELAARRVVLQNPTEHIILGGQISREPQGPVFIENDSQWADIVSWAVNVTIYAEELGVSSENIEQQLENPDPEIRRLLGVESSIGEAIGLSSDIGRAIIQDVGNYGEIYNRHLGPETPLNIDRGPNKPWNKGQGGVLSSPPFR